MSQLPARPDLDQLRRQAREMRRAALAGDAGALRRLRQVSGNVSLSAAQLAIAREYGFASWPRLKVEVERRRAQAVTGAGGNEDLAREDRTDEESALVWEQVGYPDFLTAEAEELIASQYADRPRLRPVLDAVLAALPAAGPATVQARKTFVSLVTPRRTFAVVQAATKNRVDLGLRLDQENPGGRLLPARDLGAATVRIPLTHLGLAWGDVPGDGTLRLFRGAKLRLVDIDPRLVEEALRPEHRLVARIRLTDPRGNPVCARVHPPALTWSAEPPHPQPG
jgi:hypothetical protein